jgi:hypothetical protein
MNAAAHDILSGVRISRVYQDRAGIKPHGHGETWRVPAPWRNTSDCNLSLHSTNRVNEGEHSLVHWRTIREVPGVKG